MKSYIFWMSATALAFVAALVMHERFVNLVGFSTWAAFLDAPVPTKTLMIGCITSLLTIAVITFLGARELRRGKLRTEAEIALRFFAPLLVGIGVDGWLYTEGMMQMAARATHTTSQLVLAPSRAEATLSVVVGLFAAFVALGGAAFLHRRSVSEQAS